MTEKPNDPEKPPTFVDGIPNPKRLGFISIGIASAPSAENSAAAIEAVGQALQRPIRFVDEEGYENAVTAAAIHGTKGWMAWIEHTCKEIDGFYDVDFRLRAQDTAGRELIDWIVETYNPFFGCRVGYMAWHDDQIVVVYREKHDTYACSLGVDGSIERIEITDQWLATPEGIVYRSETPDFVDGLGFPDLRKLPAMTAAEAQAAGILPPEYERWNELNRSLIAKYGKR